MLASYVLAFNEPILLPHKRDVKAVIPSALLRFSLKDTSTRSCTLGKDRLFIRVGLVMIVFFAHVRSNKCGVGDTLEQEHLEFSVCGVQ